MQQDQRHSRIIDEQSGMASILITLITMIVISLIVIGFAQIANHELRSSTDRSLSSQALYAAESGVNDAQDIIYSALANGHTVIAKTKCGNPGDSSDWTHIYTNNENVLGDGAQFTCLLVDPQPISLFYSPITDQSKIIQVQSVNNSDNITQMVLSWQNSSISTSSNSFQCSASPNQFNPQASSSSNWQCDAGVLRVDIVPFNDPSNDRVVFLYPTAGSAGQFGTYDYGSGANGSIVDGKCYFSPTSSSSPAAMPEMCNAEITGLSSNNQTGLPSGFNNGGYYLRIKAIYGDQNVNVSAPVGSTSSDVTCVSNCNFYRLINDQVLVDSTGQAQDVLKRIQVRVPVNPLDSNIVPDSAIQSQDSICKQFFVTATSGISDAGGSANNCKAGSTW